MASDDDTTMTVGQFIEKLKEYPTDLPTMFIYDSGCGRLVQDECFAVKCMGGRVDPPEQYLLLNLHPGQHWGGYDTEQEQVDWWKR